MGYDFQKPSGTVPVHATHAHILVSAALELQPLAADDACLVWVHQQPHHLEVDVHDAHQDALERGVLCCPVFSTCAVNCTK